MAHFEFSVLHRKVDAVSVDAGLSSITPRGRGGGGGESIATKFKASSRFLDSSGVIVAWGGGGLEGGALGGGGTGCD